VIVTNPEVSSVRDSDRIIGLLDSKTEKAERGERIEKHILITRYEPQRVEIEAHSDGKAVLVLSDLFHPFWTVRVDGRPVETFPVFSVLRGVRLEAGRHNVSFACVVPLMRVAWAITAGALLAIALLAWVATRYRPAPNGRDGSG